MIEPVNVTLGVPVPTLLQKKVSLLHEILFYTLLTYAGLLLFSVNFTGVVQGLDASWAYAMNLYAHGPAIFGKDIICTYGPLGYLALPQNVGHNLTIVVIVHIVVLAVLVDLLAQLWRSGQRAGALFFVVAILCSNRLYYFYWDYLLSLIVLLTLLLLLKKPGSISALVTLAATIGICFLVKFTGYILAMVLLGVYIASRVHAYRSPAYRALDKRSASREAYLLLLAVFSGPIAFLIYSPSLSNLVAYIHGSLEVASGYSATMSIIPTTASVWQAALCAATLIFCAGISAAKRWVTPVGAVMTLAILWVAFKHGYVRSDKEHAALYFCFIIVALAFLLAQVTRRGLPMAAFTVVFAALSVYAMQQTNNTWPVWSRFWWSPNVNLGQAGQLLQWKDTARQLDAIGAESFRTALISGYTANLVQSRVLIFPWDVAYGAETNFTNVPLFATQAYSTYTHYLDEQTALHIANASPPIDHVFFEWKAIDDRNPLLDVPATWNALFTEFTPQSYRPEASVLTRRPAPLPTSFQELSTTACPIDTWGSVPEFHTPLALSFNLKPTLAGRLLTTAYQLGPVFLVVQTRSGTTAAFRVPPGVVTSPFPLNYLPLDAPTLNALWSNNVVADPVVRFRLTGPGTDSLRCDNMTYFQLTGTSIHVL